MFSNVCIPLGRQKSPFKIVPRGQNVLIPRSALLGSRQPGESWQLHSRAERNVQNGQEQMSPQGHPSKALGEKSSFDPTGKASPEEEYSAA